MPCVAQIGDDELEDVPEPSYSKYTIEDGTAEFAFYITRAGPSLDAKGAVPSKHGVAPSGQPFKYCIARNVHVDPVIGSWGLGESREYVARGAYPFYQASRKQ